MSGHDQPKRPVTVLRNPHLALINQLKSGEKHPALGDKIRKAEKELAEFNEQHQGQRRGVRI